jgi:hypothetical protein
MIFMKNEIHISEETGIISLRDKSESPKLFLDIQSNCNGCTLAYKNERMLVENNSIWIFEDEKGTQITQKENDEISIKSPFVEAKHLESGMDLTLISSNCAQMYDDGILRAERTWIVYGSNVIVVADRIKSKKPLKTITEFVANNSDGLTNERIFYEKRVVLRRGDTGMKLLPLTEVRMVADCEKESGTLIYKYETEIFQEEYINIYALIIDEEKNITGWHAKAEDNEYHIDPPNNAGGIQLKISENNIELTESNERHSFRI